MLVAHFDDSGTHEDFWWQRHAPPWCARLQGRAVIRGAFASKGILVDSLHRCSYDSSPEEAGFEPSVPRDTTNL